MIERLEPFVGEWTVETSLAPPGEVRARTTWEWALSGRFLLQRSEVDLPEAPDSLCMIAADPESNGFTQHYFDSHGVVRVYAMTFEDGVWTLLRQTPDFTPLGFSQRFIGEFDADGTRIDGRWEKTEPGGSTFDLDFTLSYVKDA